MSSTEKQDRDAAAASDFGALLAQRFPELAAEKIAEFETERWKLNVEKYIDHHREGRLQAQAFSRDFGLAGLRLLFLLNGGAIIGLLAFLGSLLGKDQLKTEVAITFARALRPSFLCFVAGLASTALVALFAYLNWGFIAGIYHNPAQAHAWLQNKGAETTIAWNSRLIGSTAFLSVGAAIVALVLFLAGCLYVARAFHVLGLN
jgi:hypothetical protein